MFKFDAEKLVQAKKWKKLNAVLEKDDREKTLQIARACEKCTDDDAYNTLTTLLKHPDREIKLAAVRGLGAMKRPASFTHLSHLATTVGDDPELKEEIEKAVQAVKGSGKFQY